MVPFMDEAGAIESMIIMVASIDGSQSNIGKSAEHFFYFHKPIVQDLLLPTVLHSSISIFLTHCVLNSSHT